MRIGLVLGAGGIAGASWHVGALEAIRRATGFTPDDAELVVGTSAGAFIGALATVTPLPLLHAHCVGVLDEREHTPEHLRLARDMDLPNAGPFLRRYPVARRLPRPWLTSPRAVARGLLARRDTPAELVVTGLLGEGLLSVRGIGEIVRAAWPAGWPREGLWVCVCDADAGRRVAFGREGAPDVHLHDAVAASTAVPLLFAPVVIAGRRYLDGGCHSLANLDLAAGRGLDLVVCLSPLSSPRPSGDAAPRRAAHPLAILSGAMRRRTDARLATERRLVERAGAEVIVIAPAERDLDAMPWNHLDIGMRARVVRTALESTTEALATDPTLRALADVLRAAAARRPAPEPSHPAAAPAGMLHRSTSLLQRSNAGPRDRAS